jgi:folate-binding protein YgfZ
MTLQDWLLQSGGVLAPDGIPLHFGDQSAEYEAALSSAVLMLRSHEGRLETTGRDRLEIIQRISTNDVAGAPVGEGRPTILTSPQGRIVDRLVVYNRGDKALVTTEPGRGAAVRDYLQRQVFFNDDMKIRDLSADTVQFGLHGATAEAIIRDFAPQVGHSSSLVCVDAIIAETPVMIAQRKPFMGTQWAIIVPSASALGVWQAIMDAGQAHNLRPAGSLTYNVLRIQAGRPGIGRELSTDFIPLEAGLWDEVSFKKGCYTGQEIIARMESRNRLAKTMVTLRLSSMIDSPAPLIADGSTIGTLTSSVVTPRGEAIGIGFAKVPQAEVGNTFTVGDTAITAQILTLAGAQPPVLEART